jgi:hypothetical protein
MKAGNTSIRKASTSSLVVILSKTELLRPHEESNGIDFNLGPKWAH